MHKQTVSTHRRASKEEADGRQTTHIWLGDVVSTNRRILSNDLMHKSRIEVTE